jgi:hypothetical protein
MAVDTKPLVSDPAPGGNRSRRHGSDTRAPLPSHRFGVQTQILHPCRSRKDSILFYEAPGWLFTAVYAAFAMLVLITFIMAPPKRKSVQVKKRY